MNEHYVLLTNPTISNDVIKFNFPFNNMERVPNFILELISGSIKANASHDGVDLRMLNTVFNYSSNDNKGVSLGLFIEGQTHTFDYTQSSNARYTVNGNMNTIEFNVVDIGNSAVSNVSSIIF